jgi:16S rRNA (cytosine967-C5)-methyltransferase
MTAPARRAALRVLRDVHTGRADLPHAQARVRSTLPDQRDRALATEIVVGTLRWRANLDFIIEEASSRALTRIDPDVLDLLRLSAYQLLHLKRVPHHAIVHDAVGLARDLGKTSAAPYVNAVLRAITKRDLASHLPALPTAIGLDDRDRRRQVLDYLSVTQSHPRWLVERWYDRYGAEAATEWTRFNNTPAPITLRVNTLVGSAQQLADELARDGIETTTGTWTPNALVVTRGNPLSSALAFRGLFWFQDQAAQLVAELVTAQPGDHVLDACASPGGKSLIVAGSMADRGLLVSADIRPSRTALLSRTLSEAGTQCTRVVRLDARHPPFGPVHQWVILDAPCSGLGTLRRDPDIRWKRTAEDLRQLAATQSALLDGAATAVQLGGQLLYATCSSEPEENQAVVKRFLETHPTFALERPSLPRLAPLIDQDGFFQTVTHRDRLEAFFAATLRRHMP